MSPTFVPTRINRPAGGPDLDVWNAAFPDGEDARDLVRKLKRVMRTQKIVDRALVRAKAQFDAKVAETVKLSKEMAALEKAIAGTAWYGGETPMTPMEMVRALANSAAFPTDESSSESESSAQSGSSEGEETEEEDVGEEDESESSSFSSGGSSGSEEEEEESPYKKARYAYEDSVPVSSGVPHPIRTRTRPYPKKVLRRIVDDDEEEELPPKKPAMFLVDGVDPKDLWFREAAEKEKEAAKKETVIEEECEDSD